MPFRRFRERRDLKEVAVSILNENGERLAVSPEEAARLLGIGRTTLYRAIRRKEIRAIKIGGRRLVPVAELRRILQTHTE